MNLPAAHLQDSGEATVDSVQLLFHHMPPAWVLGLVLVPGVVLLAFWAYRRPPRSRLLQRVLAGARVALLLLALFLALGPFLRESREQTEPAPLALLYDDSASLQRRDPLPDGAAARLAPVGVTLEAEPRRLDVMTALAASAWRSTLEERYQVQAFRFSERLVPTAADGSGLRGEGAATAVGDALLSLLAENRGRRLPDVVLVSDGRSNRGADPAAVAERLSAEGVRVHVLALGDPRPAPDLSLERVAAPDLVLRGDEALFLLRVRNGGADAGGAVTVRLQDERGRVLDEERLVPDGESGTQLALSARLEEPGEHRLVAEVEPLPDETARDNNRLELPIEVKNMKIRVLYVDGTSRWEYRYLMRRLVRAPEDFQVRCWLADASRDFAQEATSGLDRLRRVPESAEDLLDHFDVVILGDADPARLGPDPLTGARFQEALAEFVRRGGGLLLCAGPAFTPSAYRGSSLEPLLPVVLSSETLGRVPFRPQPADPSLPHPVTLLDQDPRASQRVWRSLTPLWWYWPVERLRPGAQAWLVHPDVTSAEGPMPIVAGAYVPDGWVGWVGTDETWRWRDPEGERHLDRFWRALLRQLASGRLRGEQGRARLDLDRTRIELGDAVTLEARLRDESYQPLLREEGADVFLEGRPNPVHLAPVPDQPGTYRGRFRPTEPGSGLLVLTADGHPDGAPEATARFEVVLPSAEMRVTAQDAAGLRLLAARTGGTLVSADHAGDLLERLDGRERALRTLGSRDQPLDGLPLLGLFLILACGEWLARKWSNLS
ncbi:MAG: hypothetical protein EYC70_06830 [Planctomycetota bacterium]|nr:MAG: hypothetical protein EYC70_06830 [Planctomycetota bacterium]